MHVDSCSQGAACPDRAPASSHVIEQVQDSALLVGELSAHQESLPVLRGTPSEGVQ